MSADWPGSLCPAARRSARVSQVAAWVCRRRPWAWRLVRSARSCPGRWAWSCRSVPSLWRFVPAVCAFGSDICTRVIGRGRVERRQVRPSECWLLPVGCGAGRGGLLRLRWRRPRPLGGPSRSRGCGRRQRVIAAVEAAHTDAVLQSIASLSPRIAYTRTGHAGAAVMDAEGVLGIRYRHRTSRALDPQLHDHVMISNAVRTVFDGAHTSAQPRSKPDLR